MIPGELFIKDGEIELNAGRKTVTLTVANTGDRPIQVGSHYHFLETNPALKFDRKKARGMRLDIAAGTAVRFEPGQTRDVQLVALAGKRVIYGFRGEVQGETLSKVAIAVEAKGQIEIGVVLQGGGALGAYEYGAMDALLELMDEIEANGRAVRLVTVTGVSIGAINAACVVGAKNRTDARRRLKSLWDALSLEATHYWWAIAKNDFALFGVDGFYEPRRDVWSFLGWTNFYDTRPMLETLKEHVDFDLLNASETAFVITAVNRSSGELIRFRNHPHKGETKKIEPSHVLASGSLPPAFPATTIGNGDFWDGGIIDNTPLGDAIDAFSGSDDVDRILIVMNLFRKERAPPKDMIEVNDRLNELRYGNRLRQDRQNAHTVNELLQTIEQLAALVPAGSMDQHLEARVYGASRYKVLDAITDIDLADPVLMKEAGLSPRSEESGSFRDFSKTGIERRREAGYKIAQLKLRELFRKQGLLQATH